MDVADFALECNPVPVAGVELCNDALRQTAMVPELQVKYDLLAEELRSVTSACGTLRTLAHTRGDDIINFQASLDRCTDEYELLDSQVVIIEKGKMTNAVEQDGCDTKSGSLDALLNLYRDAYSHVAKRLND